jgi:tRNA(ile)-lysidine synthase
MRPRNGHIVRPLLSVDRHQIVRWLADRHLPFCTDSSNASDVYRRNFVRLRLLPLMEQLNPSVRDAILRMAGHLTDVEAIYRNAIDSHRAHLIDADGRISIDALLRTPAPQAVLFELLTPYGFTPSQCADIARALSGESGRSFVAPGGRWHLLKDRLHLILYPADEVSADAFLLAPGSELTAPIRLSLEERIVDEAFTISRSPHVATFDADRIALPLTLRRWRAGDSFVPFGMTGRKKLSDYFSDHKFSLLRKAAAWILCDASGRILWIVGHRTDNRFRITSKTRRALIITQG